MSIHNKTILLIIMMAVIAILLCSCTAAPFRLHVIANSDSDIDQQIKMDVRNAVLEATKKGILECKNASEAEEYIKGNMQTILSAANKALDESGADYAATAVVGEYEFPEKTYGEITYPEGSYHALKINLGQAEGQNWWCVMFPPLCLSEIGALDKDYELPEDVEYKSFFAELFDKWLK